MSGKPSLGSGGKADLMVAEAFYSQTRSVIDFMNEQAAKPGLLTAIAESQVKGRHMDHWLATQGTRWNLPPTVAGLEAEWQAWLDAKLGPRKPHD